VKTDKHGSMDVFTIVVSSLTSLANLLYQKGGTKLVKDNWRSSETSEALSLYNHRTRDDAAMEITYLYMGMTANLFEEEELAMDFDMRDLPTREMLQKFSERIPEIDVTATEAMLLFMRTSSNIFKVSTQRYEQFGISSGKFALLILLYRYQDTGLLATELAERAGITKATVTGLIERMERDGLVTRQDHPTDRRMSIIHLTDEGTALMNELLPLHFTSTSHMMSHLSEEEREVLLSLMQKIQKGISETEQL